MTIKLLDSVDVDTDGPEQAALTGDAQIIIRAGNYGGGTVNIQSSPASISGASGFKTLENGAFTDDAHFHLVSLKLGLKYRAQLTGSSGASNVDAELYQ